MTVSGVVERKLRDSFARQSIMTTFGVTIAEIAPGRIVLTCPILDLARQQHGFGHAGLAFTVGDTAAGYAALTLMPEDAEVMTAEMKINLVAPSDGDRMIATGRVVKAGKRLAVVTGEVKVEKAGVRTTVAILQGTMVPILPRP